MSTGDRYRTSTSGSLTEALRARVLEDILLSVRGAGPIGHAGSHEPELLHLIASVQPVTAGIPVGNDQAVPILPGPDRGNGEAAEGGAATTEQAVTGLVKLGNMFLGRGRNRGRGQLVQAVGDPQQRPVGRPAIRLSPVAEDVTFYVTRRACLARWRGWSRRVLTVHTPCPRRGTHPTTWWSWAGPPTSRSEDVRRDGPGDAGWVHRSAEGGPR